MVSDHPLIQRQWTGATASGDRHIKIKLLAANGEPYPDFLLDHIRSEWQGVQLDFIDPDICLKVDSSLSYCGCVVPTAKLRQFVYLYQQSSDFDYETVALLTRIAKFAADDSGFWDDILALELQRDCGLDRREYLTALQLIAEQVEAETALCEALLTA